MARALINLLGSGHFEVLNWTKVKSEGPSGGSFLLQWFCGLTMSKYVVF